MACHVPELTSFTVRAVSSYKWGIVVNYFSLSRLVFRSFAVHSTTGTDGDEVRRF